MRVALYQCTPRPGAVADNVARLAVAARTAAARGADLLVCPEMFLTGYNIGASAVARLAEPCDGPAARAVGEIAAGCGLAVVYGYPERFADAVFNAVQLVGPNGAIACYRKTHLFGDLDRSMFTASDRPSKVVELGGWRLGMLICYDVEFPEAVRRLALDGADLVVAPTANMVPYDIVATTIVPARAFENQIYVAYANYCGREGQLEYCGRSCIAAPDGSDAARASRDETVIVASLDRGLMAASRRSNTYLADRRPELYGT